MVISIVSKYQLWNDILIVWVKINEEMKEINTVKEHSQVILSYPDNMTKMYGKRRKSFLPCSPRLLKTFPRDDSGSMNFLGIFLLG